MNNVLVLGSNSQIGKELKLIKKKNFYLKNKEQLNLKDTQKIIDFCNNKKINIIINLAAYTNVEYAEKEKRKCLNINYIWVKKLIQAIIKKKLDIYFIYISTDFVFDHQKKIIDEKHIPNPLNYYGKTKFLSENFIKKNYKKSLIIRTSSVFSRFNKNFVNNLILNIKNNKKIGISSIIKTRPTSAKSIAKFLIKLVNIKKYLYGIVHFTNKPTISWYAFANKIKDSLNLKKKYSINKNNNYITKAVRPKNSILKYSYKIRGIYKQEEWYKYLSKDIKKLIK